MKTYPIFLAGLEGRRAVVVGRGDAAEGKARDLREAGFGEVALVDPERFDDRDLEGATLAVATDRDREVARRVQEAGRAAGVLVNAVDEPDRCDWFAPAVVRRGDLVVAIGTGGTAPALAARLRERLERDLGEGASRFLEFAARLRPIVAARVGSFEGRRRLWYRILDSEVPALVESGDDLTAWVLTREMLVDSAQEAAA